MNKDEQSLGGKLAHVLLVMVGGYFLVQWIAGDIFSRPIGQWTATDLVTAIAAFCISWFLVGVAKAPFDGK